MTTPTAEYLFNNNFNDEYGNFNGTAGSASSVFYDDDSDLPTGHKINGKVLYVSYGTGYQYAFLNSSFPTNKMALSFEFWCKCITQSDDYLNFIITPMLTREKETSKISNPGIRITMNKPNDASEVTIQTSIFDASQLRQAGYAQMKYTFSRSWSHFVFNISQDGYCSTYLNGSLLEADNPDLSTVYQQNYSVIKFLGPYMGSLYAMDVRLYLGTTLSSDEILEHYMRESGQQTSTSHQLFRGHQRRNRMAGKITERLS